ncbi:MAG: putative porin, partial [Xanthomonadales bacterium]|nr:putative porin [Xanthomonadales bacterium]
GNSFDPVTGTYLYNYEMLQAFASVDFEAFGLPATAFGNWVNNQDAPRFDTAYSLGFGLGEAKAPGSWELGYLYKDVEADAVFGLLTDSDFGGGGTDAKGHVVSATYAIHSAWNAKFTYFINEVDADTGTEHDYNRLQLDLNFKYK